MSGTKSLSPPLPHDFGKGMLTTLEERAQTLEGKSLRECSIKTFKQILEENNVTRMWLQEDAELDDWGTDTELVEELLIGDTEFEVSRPFSDHKFTADSPKIVCHLAPRYRGFIAV
jgi:hypothetical protein